MKTIFYSVLAAEKTAIEKQASGRKDITTVQNALTQQTVSQAAPFDAICVNASDDISSPILEELYNCGVRFIAIRATCNKTADLSRCAELGIMVAHIPAFSPVEGVDISTAIAEYAVAVTLYNLDCRKKDLYSGNEMTPVVGMASATVYLR